MTLEELRSYRQVRTPDYAALANCVSRAKGEKRTMAQFAEDTGIGASTLSRIANMKIQKPLSVDVLVALYENRSEQEDTYLLDALARANGLASPEHIEKINTRYRSYGRRNEEINRANLMKNAILAGVLAAGVPIKKVFDGRVMSSVEQDHGMPRHLVGRTCDFFMALGENQSAINAWKVYLYPNRVEEEDDYTTRRSLNMELHWLINSIATLFLRDAWNPESLANVKTSFAFLDEKLFGAFVETLRCAKVNNEMSILLLDPMNGYKVIEEIWIPGEYRSLSNISVFEMPVPDEADGYEDCDTYELEHTEDTE